MTDKPKPWDEESRFVANEGLTIDNSEAEGEWLIEPGSDELGDDEPEEQPRKG